MDNPDASPPQQIDLMALMGQIHSPLLRAMIESMMHYMGGHAISCLAGTLGSVLQPWREQLKKFEPDDMPPAIIEFHSGLAAIVEHTFQMIEAKKNRVILPHEQ
jgi:hypothetical protein